MSAAYFQLPVSPAAGVLNVYNAAITPTNAAYGASLPASIVNLGVGGAPTQTKIGYALGDNGSVYKLSMPDPNNRATYTATLISSGIISCFFKNAPVKTPSGYRRIDSLRVGDKVTTPTGVDVITRVYKRMGRAGSENNPYRVPTGTFGALEDLYISPRHSIAVDGKMVEAQKAGLEQVSYKGVLTYYNLELAGQSNMFLAGVEVESYVLR